MLTCDKGWRPLRKRVECVAEILWLKMGKEWVKILSTHAHQCYMFVQSLAQLILIDDLWNHSLLLLILGYTGRKASTLSAG
jgi:hypothetical protein